MKMNYVQRWLVKKACNELYNSIEHDFKDKINQLQQENEQYKKALEEIADCCAEDYEYCINLDDNGCDHYSQKFCPIKIAKQALTPPQQPEK